MNNLKYILKICYDYSNNIQWMAFYIDGKKMIENFKLEKEVLIKIFKPDSEIRDFSMYEPSTPLIYHLFPATEEFDYLNDNSQD
jgi:hypothetical protein